MTQTEIFPLTYEVQWRTNNIEPWQEYTDATDDLDVAIKQFNTCIDVMTASKRTGIEIRMLQTSVLVAAEAAV